MTSTDMVVSNQWASRPADERFTSLLELHSHLLHARQQSAAKVVSSRALEFIADPNNPKTGLLVSGGAGVAYAPTHWAFGQLAQRAQAPAGYLRTIPAPLAADCLNYGYKFARDVEDIGILLRRNGHNELAAATGPRYGRVWNHEIADMLVARFGDGVTSDFRVPGEFGHALREVTKDNTTLYASDRDMFVFLADEVNRVTIPNRRDGKTGSLARGFYIKNSEVGAGTLEIGAYLYDYLCQNRIIWGIADFKRITIRHSAGAPDRYIEEMVPVIRDMAQASAKPLEDHLKAAQQAKVDSLDAWLKNRQFKASEITGMKRAFLADEGTELKDGASLWDITTAATAYARDIKWQDDRADLEKRAGAVLELAA